MSLLKLAHAKRLTLCIAFRADYKVETYRYTTQGNKTNKLLDSHGKQAKKFIVLTDDYHRLQLTEQHRGVMNRLDCSHLSAK